MRVLDDVPIFRRTQLVTPNVVAQIRAANETGLREIHEIAVKRGSVESLASESFENLGMTYGRARLREPPKHRHTRPRAPKTRFTQHSTKLVEPRGERERKARALAFARRTHPS